MSVDDLGLAQAKPLQAQELQAIGQLVIGIAHEVNTPVQYVTDNLSFLQRAFDRLWRLLEAQASLVEAVRAGDHTSQALENVDALSAKTKLDYLARQVPRAIEQSLEGLEQVGSVVKAMRDFSQPSGAEPQPCDIHEAIESASILAKNEWRYVAELELAFDWNLPPVLLRRSEFSQVMLSSIVSAARAIADSLPPASADKGKITISTRVSGDNVEVRVSSTGAGGGEVAPPQVVILPLNSGAGRR